MSIITRVQENPDQLLNALKDPSLAALGLNQEYYRSTKGDSYNRDGIDIFEDEDWDNLILLDACRYEDYARLTPFDGRPEWRESRGSASKQFVYGNFLNKTLHDVVYISGNQWYLKLKEELGAEIHAFHNVERDTADGYVPSPENVTETALDLADQYSDKRLIIHYMQPHKPYLGEYSERFTYPRSRGLRETLRASDVNRGQLVAAYRDNLRLALDHVETLVETLDGKTVISSDHGELLGERLSPVPVRWYGHPRHIYVKELVNVPWHVVSDGPRKSITAEAPVGEFSDSDAEQVEENLKDLGYMV